jgi:hypothetical protein
MHDSLTKISSPAPKIIEQKTVDLYTILLKDDGILYCTISDRRQETLEGQALLIAALGEMTGYKKKPCFCRLESGSFPSLEIRESWAKEETCQYTSAEAFMTDSLPHKLLGNFYLNINKPKRPTRMFTDKAKAIEWLKTFL